LPAHLAGPIASFGQHFTPIEAALPTGHQIVIIMAAALILTTLLTVPVLWDGFMDGFGKAARKFLPRVFAVGTIILIIGLISHVELIDIIGGSMMGVVIAAAIADQY
jgi:hypothetical protein